MGLSNSYKKLQQGDFQYLQQEILDRFDADTRPWGVKAVVIHQMMDRLFDYHYSDGELSPSETLRQESGNCYDKGFLAANLYLASGFDVRLLNVYNTEGEGYHTTLQVKLPEEDSSKACNVLRDTNEELFGYRPGNIAWSNFNGELYYFADPGWCRYIGDRSSLTGDYIVEDSGSWTFADLDQEVFVDADDGFYEYNVEMAAEPFGCTATANEDIINWEANLP